MQVYDPFISPKVPRQDDRATYHAEGTNHNIGRCLVAGNDLRDKIRSHANNGNQADCLQHSHALECCPDRAVVGTSHFGMLLNERRLREGEGG